MIHRRESCSPTVAGCLYPSATRDKIVHGDGEFDVAVFLRQLVDRDFGSSHSLVGLRDSGSRSSACETFDVVQLCSNLEVLVLGRLCEVTTSVPESVIVPNHNILPG